MKRYFAIAALIFTAGISQAQISVSNTRVIEETPAASTGLQKIYILENASNAVISYTALSTNAPQIQQYRNLGGGYAEPVTAVTKSDNVYQWAPSKEDTGYIITDRSQQICIWVVNYANHDYNINNLSVSSSECDRVAFEPDGLADEIAYFTINGRRMALPRNIELKYNTLEYNSADEVYRQKATAATYEYIGSHISAPAPLCDTYFTLTPDRFQRAWGMGHEVTTESVQAVAVQAETTAMQDSRDSDNEQKLEVEGLGGSAPCDVTFKAAVTDAAIYRKWEISTYPEFEDVLYTYDDLEFSFSFTEAGMTYVRFVANNAAGTCEYISPTYTVSVGDSRLECPNAFSPGASEGVNDEWKVSYRSIVEFDCQIFSRSGRRLAAFTDPSQGWDGKVGGKVVPSGVYFYVIKAVGSDGKKYNLSGDINIINSRKNSMPVGGEE